jgi:hypothetical protein
MRYKPAMLPKESDQQIRDLPAKSVSAKAGFSLLSLPQFIFS